MVLLSAQGMDVAGIAKVAFTSEGCCRTPQQRTIFSAQAPYWRLVLVRVFGRGSWKERASAA